MRYSLAIPVALLFGLLPAAARTPVDVRVTADRVNLRARPSLQAETVAQVNTGDTLTARNLGDEWVEVAPPPDVGFFVHRDFVRDGVVDVARLNVRAGPGINYSETGALEYGDRVNVVGEFADWLEIEPPSAVSVWVSREYVERVDPPPPAPPTPEPPSRVETAPEPPPPLERVEPPEPEPEPVPEPPPPPPPEPRVREPSPPPPPVIRREPPVERVPVPPRPRPEIIRPPPPPPVTEPPATVMPEREEDTVEPPPALQRMGLVPLRGQGETAVYEGVLTRGSFLLIRPSRFRIVERGRGRVVTLCYVLGNESQLERLVGRQLAVHGREYWLQGTRHPVLVAERIVPEPQ